LYESFKEDATFNGEKMKFVHLSFSTTIILIVLLLGISFLTALSNALMRLGQFRFNLTVENKRSKFFFFYYLLEKFFPKNIWDNIHFTVSITKHILVLLYALVAFLPLFVLPWVEHADLDFSWMRAIFSMIIIIGIALILDFFMRFLASLKPKRMLKISSFFASFYMLLFFPLTALFLKLKNIFFAKAKSEDETQPMIVQDRIIAMLHDAGISRFLDRSEEKIIASFITFREKVAREIMVPRVDLFCLPNDISVKEATKQFVEEDYSRVPVFKDNLDQIIGILMYKDILKIYAKGDEDLLLQSVESLVKPVLYAPENKKISHLFQEFRKKQTHIAIIVNEYGGTEGVVTIEDILEELVGEEIEDEFDIEEDRQFWKLPSGSWIVDAKMSIVDIENKLNIHVPHSPEYETIGGYIFHVAGTIPSKGWSLNHDEFKIEVLISNERCIEKMRITPVKTEEK